MSVADDEVLRKSLMLWPSLPPAYSGQAISLAGKNL